MVLFSRFSKKTKLVVIAAFALVVAIAIVGCGSSGDTSNSNTGSSEKGSNASLSGNVKIDGSSTVFPISEAMAENFMKANPGVNVTVGSSGTGGGFKKFIAGETDISDASRPIKDKEKADAKKNGLEYIEIPVAYDGISLVTNKDNTWAKSITTAELKKIWEPGSKISTWKQVNPAWPDTKLSLYGPSSAHGTFDYFTDEINGGEGAIRTDYQVSEDYNVMVQGVEGDKGGLAFLGYAYYKQNENKLNILAVDGGTGPVEPTEESIKDGSYKPLARPIFIYVSKKALERPEVKAFIQYYLTDGTKLVSDVGYIPLNSADYDKSLKLVE
ncbi:MAG: phosphate ABC transporter substrate-binding protein [Candidatus Aquicultor secundus]|uniref:Phosphate-binding protein n=1 Tax=Candidatus Aquicultor secundus TaxID=1973895 RepID=A0A2M7T7R4_9ACTN|nr:PstS family phosphate ABC transporter substrate-binding protein [Candidatus Aquicultor secundus]NCO66706.1 PstS family phosphate ABC transporter substrate-binding protein [Solirubrobacter sp.]OIO84701.1 MAG: phosphate ABC transporter substrate-binding protein [Candidatus Aquicultor secundus]PIU26154.1 MAG: phosphate ABC transporter substrate-binding protein [Candidatus Aquicultor secundus]PIW22563.1 MAG: phosphate ABC transporter substrate-binding protein [Candidatus Aquicultor secundus]PIX